jgi:hypothetical protein
MPENENPDTYWAYNGVNDVCALDHEDFCGALLAPEDVAWARTAHVGADAGANAGGRARLYKIEENCLDGANARVDGEEFACALFVWRDHAFRLPVRRGAAHEPRPRIRVGTVYACMHPARDGARPSFWLCRVLALLEGERARVRWMFASDDSVVSTFHLALAARGAEEVFAHLPRTHASMNCKW